MRKTRRYELTPSRRHGSCVMHKQRREASNSPEITGSVAAKRSVWRGGLSSWSRPRARGMQKQRLNQHTSTHEVYTNPSPTFARTQKNSRPNRLKRNCSNRDRLIEKLAVLRKEAGRVALFITVRKPAPGEPVNRDTFTCTFQRKAPVLWEWYMQLVQVEEAFKTLKSDLDLRPIFHQVEQRVEAHILVAFLGYCLTVTLRMKLRNAAPGLTPRAVLGSLSAIQMVRCSCRRPMGGCSSCRVTPSRRQSRK